LNLIPQFGYIVLKNPFLGLCYEKNVPAQQTKTQKNPRLPQPHENGWRPQSHSAPAKKRAKDVSSLSCPFTKDFRLLSKSDFRSLKGNSKRLVGKTLCIDYRPSSSARLGITASGRYGSACERNRFKRLVREAFRLARNDLPPMDIHVIPRQHAKQAKLSDIAAELKLLYCDRSKNGKNAQEAPRFLSQLAGAEAAKLKKFSDGGRAKSGGCPTPADSHFLDGSSICQS
jgi:ribonuclease P protein component